MMEIQSDASYFVSILEEASKRVVEPLAIKLEEANKEIERISQELESKNAELEEAHKSVEYWRNKVLHKPSIPKAKVRSSG